MSPLFEYKIAGANVDLLNNLHAGAWNYLCEACDNDM